MYRLKARADDVPESLAARAVLRMGDWARSLFLPSVSVGNGHNDSEDGHTQEAAARRGLAAEDDVKQEAA
jgi:hypothetical protein